MTAKDNPRDKTQVKKDLPAGALDDRDQSAISPERAADKADQAEFPGDELMRPSLEDGLTARDNLEDEPEKDEDSDSGALRKP